MWYSKDVRHEDLAGRKRAKCCVFSVVLWLHWLGKSAPKNGSCGGSAAQDVAKICTTPARESDLEIKIVKTERFGTLLEVEVTKIGTTPARENDLDVKIVKNWRARGNFGCSSRKKLNCTTPARESDLGSKWLKKMRASDDFWKLKLPKLAPRLRARTIWKSKSFKHQALGAFSEVQNAFRVASPGISTQHPHKNR